MERFIKNAIDVHRMDDALVPLRFSKSQMAYFEPTPYKFRSRNAAGICLDFMTDSPFFRMRFRAKVKPGTSERLYFDILADGQLVDFPAVPIADKGSGDWTAELPVRAGEPRRITVYLPYQAEIAIEHMEVAQGALWEPAKPYGKNLLCLGDSITQGMNAAHPSSTYAVLLSRALDMNLLNQAVSGYVFDAGTIDPELPYRPDLITIAYGTNDWTVRESAEQLEERAAAYIRKVTATYPGVPVTVLSPIWRSDCAEAKRTGEFAAIYDMLERVCRGLEQVRLVSGMTLAPHHPAFFADGLHPNDEGFLHMALNLVKAGVGDLR
ncbi:SGNH/GDSL hydrolase family protein [Paenibacillus sp.]|uniref:SGNH/GDSL hydrolase family protein n=1 Tax=Paenibacillus sp. TaxID=58172 RepID=UPI002D72F342|nr:SGNH/GDSL hydrolase family protein [Paenibacillus sp.]HZG85856.1 SGNH/GDSL hydrolase family protein [Paenibacillus sp.]